MCETERQNNEDNHIPATILCFILTYCKNMSIMGRIGTMKTYTDITKTGMKLHIFIHLVCIPITLLLLLANLLYLRGSEANFVFYYSFTYYCVSIILLVLCFIGFWKLQKFSYYCVMIYCGLSLMDSIILFSFLFLLSFSMDPSSYSSLISTVITNIIKVIIVFIYYYKRRKLFTQEGYNNPYKKKLTL